LPIWICPIQSFDSPLYDFYKMDPSKLYVNFGFWDSKPTSEKDGFYNRQIEKKVQDLNGNKSLYSNVFYTKDEFWAIYNEPLYRQLKNKYDQNHHLKDLYQKIAAVKL